MPACTRNPKVLGGPTAHLSAETVAQTARNRPKPGCTGSIAQIEAAWTHTGNPKTAPPGSPMMGSGF